MAGVEAGGAKVVAGPIPLLALVELPSSPFPDGAFFFILFRGGAMIVAAESFRTLPVMLHEMLNFTEIVNVTSIDDEFKCLHTLSPRLYEEFKSLKRSDEKLDVQCIC